MDVSPNSNFLGKGWPYWKQPFISACLSLQEHIMCPFVAKQEMRYLNISDLIDQNPDSSESCPTCRCVCVHSSTLAEAHALLPARGCKLRGLNFIWNAPASLSFCVATHTNRSTLRRSPSHKQSRKSKCCTTTWSISEGCGPSLCSGFGPVVEYSSLEPVWPLFW